MHIHRVIKAQLLDNLFITVSNLTLNSPTALFTVRIRK